MESSSYRRNGQRWLLVPLSIFLIIIAIVLTANLLLRPARFYPWYPFGFSWIWVPFAFFFLFFALRWFFWPWGWGYHHGYWTGNDAHLILRERFAKGEITREQFEQMTRDLEQSERLE
jgi:putative membrane protein